MVERKLFKTKLCVLYQKGHCPRQNCSFAHGDAELRRTFDSFNGKRDHRGSDLRNKLDRRLSPQHRYSLGAVKRGWRTFHGSSPSKSFERNSDRKRKKKERHFDGQRDFSGSLKSSDGAGDQVKRSKSMLTGSRIVSKEQINEVESEINILDLKKYQLRTLVQEKDEEADVLTSRIRELDSQLSKEKEECKRITLKIRKFVKAHKRYVRVQEELRRSQVRLQKLGDQLLSGTNTIGGNEEDSSVNIVSDEEGPDSHALVRRNEMQNNSPGGKSLHAKCVIAEELPTGLSTMEMLGQLDEYHDQLKIDKEIVMADNENDGHRLARNEGKQKKGSSVSASMSSSDKVKGSGAPSTSMAAHAVDEVVDIEGVETASMEIDKGTAPAAVRKLPFLLPPPPPIPPYLQYEGKDEKVDVEELGEEMVEVDIV